MTSFSTVVDFIPFDAPIPLDRAGGQRHQGKNASVSLNLGNIKYFTILTMKSSSHWECLLGPRRV